VVEAVHDADHYAFFPASGRDKSFTSGTFRFMIGPSAEHEPGGSMRMRVLGAAAIVALLAGPVYAQQKSVPQYGDMGKAKTQSEIDEDKAAERAYQRSLSNVPDKGPVDPWGNARSVEAPKAAAKTAAPAKPKTKTGEAAK
jgi:hypothetical protein